MVDGMTLSRDSHEEVRELMEEYVANFEPVLSEPGVRLFDSLSCSEIENTTIRSSQ